MRIVCLGGGPAGLYAAILLKKAAFGHNITVIERHRPEESPGRGIVFSDSTLANLRLADEASFAAISAHLRHWDSIDIYFKGTRIRSRGHGFSGLSRRTLVHILQQRAAALGVRLEPGRQIGDPAAYAGYDLVIGADGVQSPVRQRYQDSFAPEIEQGRCRYLWLGSDRKLDAFTFAFVSTQWGWFTLHAYRYDEERSTFIVEAREETWRAAGLDRADTDASLAFCERLFAEQLDGRRLSCHACESNVSWQKFQRVLCRRWHHGNFVLVGDAAHTTHFSIGSGTKLAMEDAVALARWVERSEDLGQALAGYEKERRTEMAKLASAARNRMRWFEHVERYARFEPLQFAYSLLTGSQRIGHDNLKLRDPEFVSRIESDLTKASGAPTPRPPMFNPFQLRGLTLSNRVVVSPMAMYSCRDGIPGDFLLVHLGARALGGAGLVMTEMTCVSPQGRISPGCAGLWNEEQAAAWARIVAFVHGNSAAKLGLQLGHSGPKGSTQLGWERPDEPLPEHNWPIMAASALPYGPNNQVPRMMSRADMDMVREQFVAAARRGAACGFDLLELHYAHGYLMASFISPLTNRRQDEYGGSLENRLRYPLEVLVAVRDAWPAERPLAVRISAHDWTEGGNTPDDAVRIARLLKQAGADIIDVSSGNTTRAARPVYGRMYQTPFADQIRNEAGIATIAVGSIFEPDHVNSIVAAGRADLCAIARAHLSDPAWTLHAAARQAYGDIAWPQQYLLGKEQLERNLARTGGEPAAASTSRSGNTGSSHEL